MVQIDYVPGVAAMAMTTEKYLAELGRLIDAMPREPVDNLIEILMTAYEHGRTVFILGNGGSAATASHFACDLGKGTAKPDKKRFRAMSLTDQIPVLTAWANDVSYDCVFAEQLEPFVAPEDVVIGISASGNSVNVLNAIELARSRGAVTVGITGYQGGKLKDICELCIIVPSANMQQIEDMHVVIEHVAFSIVRDRV